MKRVWLVWFDAGTMDNAACSDIGDVEDATVGVLMGMRGVAAGRVGRFVVAKSAEQAKGVAAKTMFVDWPLGWSPVAVGQ